MMVTSMIFFLVIFGVIVTIMGFALAWTARTGTGQTTIRLFGAEITLAAAGGILVMLMGVGLTTMPLLTGRDTLDLVDRDQYEVEKSERKKLQLLLKQYVNDKERFEIYRLGMSSKSVDLPNKLDNDRQCANRIGLMLSDMDKENSTVFKSNVVVSYDDYKGIISCRGKFAYTVGVGKDPNKISVITNRLQKAITDAYAN